MDFDSIEKLSNEEIEELYQHNIDENILKSICLTGTCASGYRAAGRSCWKYCGGNFSFCSGELNSPSSYVGCNLNNFTGSNSASNNCKYTIGKPYELGAVGGTGTTNPGCN